MQERDPTRVPVIIERSSERGATALPLPTEFMFMMPKELTISDLLNTFRESLVLSCAGRGDAAAALSVGEQTMHMLVGGQCVWSCVSIGEAFEQYKASDGFLYTTYTPKKTIWQRLHLLHRPLVHLLLTVF